jgi:chorismate synthase
MGSTIGNNFAVTTFGESHGLNVGAVVDGCPALLELSEADIQPQLDRRRPGQSVLSTPRDEKDQVRIVSGVENGLTLGTPITMLVDNKDQRPGDYKEMSNIPRPSHADFTYKEKYGVMAASGGGRASARETIGRVVAGAVAEKILANKYGVSITAFVSSVQDIVMPESDILDVSRDLVDKTIVRCPDTDMARLMEARIAAVLDDGDSVGGTVTCVCQGVTTGWGEPIFDKLEAMLARAMLSIPATKGFEIGSGFAGTLKRGFEHNDMFVMKKYGIGTVTNNSGGIQGGISNGEPIIFKVAFKPVATISLPQDTVDYDGKPVVFEAKGRHDPCVLPRAVPIVESMAAIVLADMALG